MVRALESAISNMSKNTSPKVPPGATSQPSDLPATYEEALQELDALVNQLDNGQLPLDTLLTQYQRGAALLGFCRSRLQAVEQQIQVLENGELKPWTGAA
jgi:exodeoxyribonuclease VII small subunit